MSIKNTNDTAATAGCAPSAGSVTSRRTFLASIAALVGIPTVKIPLLTSHEWPAFGTEWDVYDGVNKTHRVRAGDAGEVLVCRFYNQAPKGSDIVLCFAAEQPRWLSQNDQAHSQKGRTAAPITLKTKSMETTIENTVAPSVEVPRLVRRCPFCGSASVWSFGVAEWRCEKCTNEWNGSANTALTDDGHRCARCNASMHETEKIHGCIMCAANS